MGPLMVARTLAMYAESVGTPRRGFAGASTVYPRSSSRVMTPPQPEASAKAPWIRTMVGLGPSLWCAAADVAGLAEAPAPAKRVTPMMADSAANTILFSPGLLVKLRTFTGTSWVGSVRPGGERYPGAGLG